MVDDNLINLIRIIVLLMQTKQKNRLPFESPLTLLLIFLNMYILIVPFSMKPLTFQAAHNLYYFGLL